MKILLTGATGYIAKRLLPVLISEGHEVVCCVRDRRRFDASPHDAAYISVIEVDFLKKKTLDAIPSDIDAAYYLIHSMTASIDDFECLEKESARNFRDYIGKTNVRQVVYLSGIVNDRLLSKHLLSRKAVEDILSEGSYHLTTLRAGIIVGSGSASFEIIRDLVEKLPVMVAPRWVKTRCQPIAIRNVIQYLTRVLDNEKTFDKSFDIGGPDVLSYKEMLLRFAEVRNLKRRILVLPVLTPRLSSYFLYFITSTSYKLAANLVNSMKVEVVCCENDLNKLVNIELIPYKEAVMLAFDKIMQEEVLSSWIDALSQRALEKGISRLVNMPCFGCIIDKKRRKIKDEEEVLKRIWSIGGRNGWYFATRLWHIRGVFDKFLGGVGYRRGRRSLTRLHPGDTIDSWRVLLADKKEKRLLLYSELKMPGEAWLEFRIKDNVLYQTHTFRPLGVMGRLYWVAIFPVHHFIFSGMIRKLAKC